MSEDGGHVIKDSSWEEGAWTQVPNDIVRDRALSLDAKGLILVLASHSVNFEIRLEPLRLSVGVGREKLRKLLRELEDAGYMTREKTWQKIDGFNRRGPNRYVLTRSRARVPEQLVSQVPENEAHGLTCEDMPSVAQQPDSEALGPEALRESPSYKKNNTKKNKKDGDAKASTPRGCRLPEDFKVTPEMVAWFNEKCPSVKGQGSRLTEEFRNYWAAESGARASKSNWEAAWRNWMLKADGWSAQRPQRQSPGGRTKVYTAANGVQIER